MSMQSVFRLILLSTLGFVLAGCGTMLVPQKSGFSQQAALQDIPSSWTNSKQPYASGVQSLRSLTNDKALLAYIDQVLEQNISLRQSELAYQRAELERQKAAGGLWPNLNLSSTADRSRSKSQQAAPGQKRASYANNIGLDASINWELDIWGKLADRKKAASAG
ncbi:MAG TPA: TolC family protein, partial [Rhizobiales bacterium]|nr:TolC family protein [Hyphomicrobiales bacterium]